MVFTEFIYVVRDSLTFSQRRHIDHSSKTHA